jgi:hypothetical protein
MDSFLYVQNFMDNFSLKLVFFGLFHNFSVALTLYHVENLMVINERPSVSIGCILNFGPKEVIGVVLEGGNFDMLQVVGLN